MSLADGNLESAISLLFESGVSGGSGSSSASATVAEQQPNNEVEPEIRAPILPTQEVLVPPDIACPFPRNSNNLFDRFRDFAVETSKYY